MAPDLWEYTADTPTLSKIIHFFATNFILKRTFTFHYSAHCFPFVFKEFPPSDEELDAYRNGEVC